MADKSMVRAGDRLMMNIRDLEYLVVFADELASVAPPSD